MFQSPRDHHQGYLYMYMLRFALSTFLLLLFLDVIHCTSVGDVVGLSVVIAVC